jgi:predicted small lipoprotein YifL
MLHSTGLFQTVILIVMPVLYLSRITVLLGAVGLLAACGQKGPLVMPSRPEAVVAPSKPVPAKPAPALAPTPETVPDRASSVLK